jgi:glutamate dehydrogenase (NADP+)
MVQKLVQEGARVVTLSDSSGHIYDEEGITEEKLEFILELKNVFRGRISEYVKQYPKAVYTAFDPNLGHNKIWDHRADCAFPCATQNEINAIDASNLVKNGVKLVAEGSNMSTVPEGVAIFQDSGILFAPGKAANAGRSRHLGAGNEPEQPTHGLDQGGCGQAFEDYP